MKHLLNNLTEQEKNSIREQHTGGMRVSNNRFKALLENKLGNSKPLVEKFDDEDDYNFEYNTDSINEQDFSLSGVPVSASYSSSSNTPVKRYNVSTPVSDSTTSSPAREQVVNDCFRQIYYVMAIDKQTLFDRAKTTKHNKELFANGEIPTEEEWSLAEEKFMMINMKGVFNLD